MYDTLLFRCAICERDVRDFPDRNGRDRHLEPLCRMCESHWTGGAGRSKDGSFMDRRKVMHVSALASALHNHASIIKWSASHGSA